jgi:Family of unknown function (DUF6165)
VTTEIFAPISVGELFDKITILEIKLEYIAAAEKRANIAHELFLLKDIAVKSGVCLSGQERDLHVKLKTVNIAIWKAEDQMRDFDHRGVFDNAFVQTARSIRRLNDTRAAIKKAINQMTSSAVVEEKGFSVHVSDV